MILIIIFSFFLRTTFIDFFAVIRTHLLPPSSPTLKAISHINNNDNNNIFTIIYCTRIIYTYRKITYVSVYVPCRQTRCANTHLGYMGNEKEWLLQVYLYYAFVLNACCASYTRKAYKESLYVRMVVVAKCLMAKKAAAEAVP